MGAAKTTLIAFSIATIFSIGLASPLAYGGDNSVIFEENFVHSTWIFDPAIGPTQGLTAATIFDPDLPNQFELFQDLGPVSFMECGGLLECKFKIPNFIDELDTKIIFIDITFDPTLTQFLPIPVPEPGSPTVKCFDPIFGPLPDGFVFGSFIEQGFDAPNLFIYDFKCEPNPDWEEITIQLDRNIVRVEIWTESFDEITVGGTMVPLDTTALLLAGVQSISMWMIPVVIAGVGIGVFVIIRRK